MYYTKALHVVPLIYDGKSDGVSIHVMYLTIMWKFVPLLYCIFCLYCVEKCWLNKVASSRSNTHGLVSLKYYAETSFIGMRSLQWQNIWYQCKRLATAQLPDFAQVTAITITWNIHENATICVKQLHLPSKKQKRAWHVSAILKDEPSDMILKNILTITIDLPHRNTRITQHKLC